MGFKDISIKKKFIILTGVVAIFMLIISFVGYFNTSQELNKSLTEEVTIMMEKEAADMDGWLSQRIALAQAQATLMSNFNGDMARMKAKENMSLATYDKYIVDMGIGLEDGTFTSYSLGLTKLDPRTRSWYTNMKSSSSSYNITDPYVDSNTNQTLVSLIAPIKNGGSFIGAVCADIGLDILSEKAEGVKYRGVGAATFLDAEGNVIATSSPNVKNVTNFKDIIDTPEHMNQILTTNEGNFVFKYNGQDYVLGFATIPSTNWIVGITIPYDAVFGVLSRIKIMFAVITIICVVIITLFCIKISNAMTEPILQLESHAKQLSQGNLRVNDINVEGTDEIASLTHAFNTMSNNLRKLIQKMLTTSEQLAAASEQLTASSTQSANTSVQIAETVSEVGGDITKQMQDIEAAK